MKSGNVSLVFDEQKLNAHTRSGVGNTGLISLTASAWGLITAKCIDNSWVDTLHAPIIAA